MELSLDPVKTRPFNDFLLIPLSKKWLQVNDGKPLVFEAKLEGSQLVLCANLARLQSTKEVDTNGM